MSAPFYIAASLFFTTLFLALVLVTHVAGAGELMQCQLEQRDASWHYRTKIAPKPDWKCWYEGERMKPRNELFWAEVPAIAPMEQNRPPWARRGAPEGWDHQEGAEDLETQKTRKAR